MNKLVVVGHPISYGADLKNFLINSGMNEAKNKEGGVAVDSISKAMCKLQGIKLPSECTSIKDLKFTKPDVMTENIIFDFLIDNVDAENIVWNDMEILPFLNFWKLKSKNTKFIFVYNHPILILYGLLKNKIFNEEVINEKLTSWSVYNNFILDFYMKNKSICRLVGGDNFEVNGTFFNQLKTESIYPGAEVYAEILDDKELGSLCAYFYNKHVAAKNIYEKMLNFSDIKDSFESVDINHLELVKKYYEHKCKGDLEKRKNDEILACINVLNNQYLGVVEENKILLAQKNKESENLNGEIAIEIENQKEILSKKDSEIKELNNEILIEKDKQKMLLSLVGTLQLKVEEFLEKKYQEEYKLDVYQTLKSSNEYVLGNMLVKHPKTLKSMAKLPYLAFLEKVFLSKNEKNIIENLGLNDEDPDVKKLKNHLSYKVGYSIYHSTDNMGNFINLPFKLMKDIYGFKSEKLKRD